MRKHAASWGIKALLAMIIVSFVLFFGYSKITKMQRAGIRGTDSESVGIVNHMRIPASEYRFYYDNAMERMRDQFKDKGVPEFMKTMVEQTSMSQLIQKELKLQMADSLGVRITDDELAKAIENSQIALRGSFDPIFYKHQYLPYFENRFGINFEDMLRNDLRSERLQSLFMTEKPKGKDDAQGAASPKKTEKLTQWTFEIATLDTDAMIKGKTLSSQEEASKAAEEFISTPYSEWKTLAKKYDAKIERVDGVTLDSRGTKLPGYSFEDYKAMFALNDVSPIVSKPIARKDNKIVVARLISREETERESAPLENDFFRQWMTGFASHSKIHTFLDNQQAKK